jgi:hypothetical protein
MREHTIEIGNTGVSPVLRPVLRRTRRSAGTRNTATPATPVPSAPPVSGLQAGRPVCPAVLL